MLINFPQVGRITITSGVTEIRGLAAPVQLLGRSAGRRISGFLSWRQPERAPQTE